MDRKIKVPSRSALTQGGPYVGALHARYESESEMLGGQRADVVRMWRQVQDQDLGGGVSKAVTATRKGVNKVG